LAEPEPEPEKSGRNSQGVRPIALGVNEFEHERLDVYRTAIEFLAVADTLAGGLPRGRSYLTDQLRRAASSISFNIAEGAGEFASADKARFYRMARRSATESAAILDACRVLALADDATSRTGRGLLLRLVAMLTAMVLKISGSGSS
jgi:four helix bundle protein